MARPKRRAIGEKPVDAVVPRAPSLSEKDELFRQIERIKVAGAEPEKEAPTQAKERMTLDLPVDVMERAKNAVFWTPGLTLADLAAHALTEAVDHLEKKRRKPFPARKADMKGGGPKK